MNDQDELPEDERQEESSGEGELVQFSLVQKTAVFVPAAASVLGLDLLLHAPLPLAIAGIIGAVALARKSPDIYQALRGHHLLPTRAAPNEREQGDWTMADRLLGKHLRPQESPEERAEPEAGNTQDPGCDPHVDEEPDELAAAFAHREPSLDVPGIRRITVDQMVSHTPHNSYTLYLGRSLTLPRHPVLSINFFKRHIKLIGASQHGKSSMAAALLEAIIRTHDRRHVLLALLDLEHKTSRLFADAPNIATVLVRGEQVRLHARSYAEVLEHLEYILAIIEYRYQPQIDLDAQPLLIVYLEEFVDLKDYFKQRARAETSKEEKAQAEKDYARLVYCIKKIAARGLKVYVQFLMCAQVDYRDDDLQEALVNVTSGMSFCVRPSAAQAAGFYRTELIKRNAMEDKVGQCVVEMPDCKDLILAPEYPLAEKLRVLHSQPTYRAQRQEAREEVVNVNAVNAVNALEKRVNAGENAEEHSLISENIPPAFTPSEEVQVLLAYAEILAASPGKPITRTGIRDYLRWDNKQYTRILKPVCDKHHIGKEA